MGLIGLCPLPCAAREGDQEQTLTPSASVLQVTGSQNKISISASHADLLSALKLVFTQAHRQFVPDGGLSGEVTLSLTDQTFAAVLGAIDHQAFLRFDIDAYGVFHFHRDYQSLQETFVRMKAVNALLRDQLQRMGYTVPSQGSSESLLSGRQMGSQFGSPLNTRPFVLPLGQSAQTQADGGSNIKPGGETPATNNNTAVTNNNGVTKNNNAAATKSHVEGQGQQAEDTLTPYDQYLRAQGLVGVRAVRTQPMPIVDVLKQFSRQAGIPILVDPGIPNGLRFRFYGNIVRPLPEALNLLAAVAQLEWHQANGQIFITTTPEFSVVYGNSDTPGGVYPPSSQGAASRNTQSAHAKTEPGVKSAPVPHPSGG